MARKAKSKSRAPESVVAASGRARSTASSTGATTSSSAAFNYSWRTGVTLVAIGLTLLVFLALPLRPDLGAGTLPRWLFGLLALEQVPGFWMTAIGEGSVWPTPGERFLAIGWGLLGICTAGSVGFGIGAMLFRDREVGEHERAALSMLLGLGILSACMLLWATLGLVGSPAAAILWLFGASLFALTIHLVAARARVGGLRQWINWPQEFSLPLWATVGVPATLLALLYGILPPFDFDVLEYHFQIPKEWHQAGGIVRSEGNVYGAMPMGAEMFVLWGMETDSQRSWWRGALVGKAILAAFIPLTSLLSASIAARLAGGRAGLFAGWTALTAPWFWMVGTSGLVDHVWGAYFLAASWTAFRTWFDDDASASRTDAAEGVVFDEADVPVADSVIAVVTPSVGQWTLRESPSLRWAALTGAFFGAACACKYPAVPLIGGPLLVLHVACFVIATRRGRASNAGSIARPFAKTILLAGLAAAALGGGWYLKNAVQYGNPVFPLMTGVFGDAGWPDELQANWNRVHAVPGNTFRERWSPIGLAGLAWQWLVASAWASPLIVAGLVAFAFSRRQTRTAWIFVALAAGFFVLLWATTHRIERFFLPTYPLLAVVAGIGWAAGETSFQRRFRQVAFWLGLAWCGAIVLQLDDRILVPLDTLRTGNEIATADRPPRIDPAVQWLNEHATEGTTLSIGDAAVYDFTVPVRYHTCFDECPLQVWYDEVAGDTEALRERLRANDISFVYVDWEEIERYRSPGNYGFPFPIVTRESFAEFVESGVVEPPVAVGPPMGEGGPPAWEIYPVPKPAD